MGKHRSTASILRELCDTYLLPDDIQTFIEGKSYLDFVGDRPPMIAITIDFEADCGYAMPDVSLYLGRNGADYFRKFRGSTRDIRPLYTVKMAQDLIKILDELTQQLAKNMAYVRFGERGSSGRWIFFNELSGDLEIGRDEGKNLLEFTCRGITGESITTYTLTHDPIETNSEIIQEQLDALELVEDIAPIFGVISAYDHSISITGINKNGDVVQVPLYRISEFLKYHDWYQTKHKFVLESVGDSYLIIFPEQFFWNTVLTKLVIAHNGKVFSLFSADSDGRGALRAPTQCLNHDPDDIIKMLKEEFQGTKYETDFDGWRLRKEL